MIWFNQLDFGKLPHELGHVFSVQGRGSMLSWAELKISEDCKELVEFM